MIRIHPRRLNLAVLVCQVLQPLILSFGCVLTLSAHQSAADPEPPHDADLSAPRVKMLLGLKTPMRDGTRLSSNVWLPEGAGRYPTILVRTPYVKDDDSLKLAGWGTYFARRGYAYVVQDTRGRGDSEGVFNFFFPEGKDGYDSIEWFARRPWSNGRVCTMGVSYLATDQWLAAREKPPHLVCMAPTSPSGEYLNELPATGGAFMMSWALHWLNHTSGHAGKQAINASIDWNRVYLHRPILTMDEAMGRKIPLFRQFLKHDTLDEYWKRIQFEENDFRNINIPVLTTTGLFDADQAGALFYWSGMHSRSGNLHDQFLIIGPWTHAQSFNGGAERVGELALPQDSIIDTKELHLAFFDRYLKESSRQFAVPNVRVFVTGSNVWRDFQAWPVPGAKPTGLYLSSDGHANAGGGELSWKPATFNTSDTYTYNPKSPLPSAIGRERYAVDRSGLERRSDVLVYSTPPLEKALQIIGPVEVQLYASSDARDTDFTAALEDVPPNGKAVVLGPRPVGIVRARYRRGPAAAPELLTPGRPTLFHIELGAIAHEFQPGHRVRLEISSSSAPDFNPNQNTGAPIATDLNWKVANQTVLHDDVNRSAVMLPIVPLSP